jgi:hypothetical protein
LVPSAPISENGFKQRLRPRLDNRLRLPLISRPIGRPQPNAAKTDAAVNARRPKDRKGNSSV